MNKRNSLLTIIGFFLITPFVCSAAQTFCPHNEEVAMKINVLAEKGTHHLIGKDKTNIYYTAPLLENDTQLNGFLQISKLFDSSLPKLKVQLIELLPQPNFCAYKISFKSDEGETSQVIALSPEP